MAKQALLTQTKLNKKHQPMASPPQSQVAPDPAVDKAAQTLPPPLVSHSLQSAQRQAMVAHLGQAQGNRQVQRVMASFKSKQPLAAPVHQAFSPDTHTIARLHDDGPYTPGEMSELYHKLPPEERAKVNTEVDRRFQAETGLTRKLDPGNPADSALINIWLRIRDEVMTERAAPPEGPKPEEPKPEEPKPEPPKSGLSFEEAKEQIEEAAAGWGTDEDAIYNAIRQCYERAKLAADAGVQAILNDELSDHELWLAQLLLAFGSEAAFPGPIQEIWSATEGWGTDEDRIYQTLQKLSQTEIAQLSKVPGLRAILDSELSGNDLKAAEDLLSGEYAKALARHKQNVNFVKQEFQKMRDPAQPLHVRNTAEWLDPTDASQQPKNNMYILTPTHDSAARAKEQGKDGQVAYFGDAPKYPSDSADYDAHISSKRNIHYSAPSVAGEHLGRDIWVHDPAYQTNISLQQVLVHEVQHDADRHDTEKGHDKSFKSPEESWNRYKTEFRAYWLDGQRDSLSARAGSAAAPWDNQKQEAIFKHMYGSSETDVYAVWLRPNYDKNTEVDGKKFQDLVHGYTKPEGVNLINSPRIDTFFVALDKCKKEHTDLAKTPLLELEGCAKALTTDDQVYINSADAGRLQQMMKDKLENTVLEHVATITNGGTRPGWL